MTLADRPGILTVMVSASLAVGCIADSTGAADGGRQPNECKATWDYEQGAPELPPRVYLGATGSGVLSLDERVDNGWRVSLVTGDLTVPGPLADGGTLSRFSPGDRIAVTARNHCQPFSGCKDFIVIRDARDGALVAAGFRDDAGDLPDFAAAVGLPLTLQSTCSFRPGDVCFVNQVETHHSLRLVADQIVELQRHAHAGLTIGGTSYTAWLGSASTVTGSERVSSSTGGCVDLGSFWATGGIELMIVP